MKKIKWLIMLLLALIYIFIDSSPEKYLNVYFFDVGQGDASLIRTPDGVNILVDAGPDNKILYELAERLPWWDRKIDFVVISHWHADHFLGLISLQRKYDIGKVLVNGHEPDQSLYKIWEAEAIQKDLEILPVVPGQVFELDSNTRWQILYDSSQSPDDFNDTSIVMRFTYGQTDILFTGDLPSEKESLLVEGQYDLSSEILKVGHHGSRYSSSQPFLDKILPELCVIQSGQDNKFGHPHPEALARLSAVGCQVRNNQDLGTIHVRTDGQKWWLES